MSESTEPAKITDTISKANTVMSEPADPPKITTVTKTKSPGRVEWGKKLAKNSAELKRQKKQNKQDEQTENNNVSYQNNYYLLVLGSLLIGGATLYIFFQTNVKKIQETKQPDHLPASSLSMME